MLVLARRVGERILIGDEIAITVVKVASGGVRIGVEAPPELAVVREELAEQLAREEADRVRQANVADRPVEAGRKPPQ